MTMLRTHMLEQEIRAQHEAESQTRRLMVGSGDRSEKSRTYNYPQNRVTDHRIDFTSYNLPAFMDGDLDEMLDAVLLQGGDAVVVDTGALGSYGPVALTLRF